MVDRIEEELLKHSRLKREQVYKAYFDELDRSETEKPEPTGQIKGKEVKKISEKSTAFKVFHDVIQKGIER